MRSDAQPFIQTPGTLPAGRWHPGGIYAVWVGPERLVVRDSATGREAADVPRVAVAGEGRVVAIGGEAARAVDAGGGDLVLVQPFAVASVADVDVAFAGRLLREFIRRTRRGIWPPFVRGMVVAPEWPEALSEGERAALTAIGRSTGAWTTLVWEGRALSDREVCEAIAPPSHRL